MSKPQMNPAKLSVVKEARGQWAVVDWSRGGPTAAGNTLLLFRTERDARRFVSAATGYSFSPSA